MGRILRAWDSRHERNVALKLRLHDGDETARRFEREARIVARLQHPSIVPLYEAGHTPGGEPFYAMRLVDARPLATVLLERATAEERLALLPNVIAVADAIAYAHARRIVHGGLKPSSVLLGAFGETLVVDWAFARGVAADGEGAADEQVDVHALGALLSAVIGGAGAPAELQAIVARATADDPEARRPTAREISDDLKRFVARRLATSARRSRGRRAILSLSAVVTLALAAGVLLLALVVVRDRGRSARARTFLRCDPALRIAGALASSPPSPADADALRDVRAAIDACRRDGR